MPVLCPSDQEIRTGIAPTAFRSKHFSRSALYIGNNSVRHRLDFCGAVPWAPVQVAQGQLVTQVGERDSLWLAVLPRQS